MSKLVTLVHMLVTKLEVFKAGNLVLRILPNYLFVYLGAFF